MKLSLPTEGGVSTDFIACIVRNDYGLGERVSGEVTRILDVGANVGLFALAARSVYKSATIHCYEPNRRSSRFLINNTRSLNISVHEEAVGAEDGAVTINDSADSNLATTTRSATGTVPQTSFSKAISRMGGCVDILKLDCEGAEWDLFEARECWENVRNLRMEYHLLNCYTVSDVSARLQMLGFTIIKEQHDVGCGIIWATRK